MIHRITHIPALLLCSAITLLIACPDEEGFNPVPPIPPLAEGHCHLDGAFFVADDLFAALDHSTTPQPGLSGYDCDADGDGTPDGLYYADPWSESALAEYFHWDHGGASGAALNGAHQGMRPVIYVGGVRPDEAGSDTNQVFLWISYAGPATFWTDSYDNAWNRTVACTAVWSWNVTHHEPDIPVSEDLDDLCAAAGIDSGNTQLPCRFGFFPLGIFVVDTIDGISHPLNRQGTGAQVYLHDGEPTQLRDTTCGTDAQDVADALDDGVYLEDMDWYTCQRFYDPDDWDCEVFGDTAYPYQTDDSLWGFDWDTFEGLNESGTVDDRYDFVIRAADFATVPATFQATIESIQSTQYGFVSACGC